MTNETLTSSIIDFISSNLDLGSGDISGIIILIVIGSVILLLFSKYGLKYSLVISSLISLLLSFLLNNLGLVGSSTIGVVGAIFIFSVIYLLWD